MADKQLYTRGDGVDAPARKLYAVTPSDATVLDPPCKALFIGGAGNIVIKALDDSAAVTLTGVVAGTILPVRALQVLSTGTTATNITALA